MWQGALDDGLNRLGAEALLVVADSSRDPDLAVFAGTAHLGQCFLLARKGREPLLGYLVDMERDEAAATGFECLAPTANDLREARRQDSPDSVIRLAVLEAALDRAGLTKGVLALAGHPPAGQALSVIDALEKRGFGFADGRRLVLGLRKLKADHEVGAVRSSASGTCSAFRRVARTLAEAECRADGLFHGDRPITAGTVRREIRLALAEHGLEQPEGNIVAIGADAGVPHTKGADSVRLKPGRSMVVDLYPKGLLFADCARTFCLGEPGAEMRTAHGLCLRALEESRAAARPGALGADLQSGVCSLFEKAGFRTARSHPGTRTGYVHGLGHGVGYELHELPSFRRPAEGGTLEVGDVFTIEPGLYDPESGYGVRLEDLFLMTENGPENLTPLPYEMDPKAW